MHIFLFLLFLFIVLLTVFRFKQKKALSRIYQLVEDKLPLVEDQLQLSKDITQLSKHAEHLLNYILQFQDRSCHEIYRQMVKLNLEISELIITVDMLNAEEERLELHLSKWKSKVNRYGAIADQLNKIESIFVKR